MLNLIRNMNDAVGILFTVAYAYQIVYLIVALANRKKTVDYTPSKMHRFGAVVCARNESAVIGELVTSLKKQKYPQGLLEIFVLADNCTDDTAAAARRAGAVVYERNDTVNVGKGYALDYLFKKIHADYTDNGFDAYCVFDADNIVDENFIAEMNKVYDRGYDVITCYRNSKNFASNWISASYSIWFLREARFMNFPRMILGNNCAIGGTGFTVSDRVIKENGGWPFHTLTEDIEFSANCAANGRKIGYCDKAVVYDEQPTSFVQSYKQRLRWSKGFYQVSWKYASPLAGGMFRGGKYGMSCYDIFWTVAPGMLLSVLLLIFNITVGAACIQSPGLYTKLILRATMWGIGTYLIMLYVGVMIVGLMTVICEWKNIRATTAQKLLYLPIFPFFMLTYLPIALIALFCRVKWSPIKHTSSAMLARK